ncbi:hypothetical protein [Gimesia algae]|uniref:Uncharacterized protein n=1 Tax=Gimesia algae TaxID=2527971 RepID=A0A517V7I7_9PLAN|nr:hypothetical protein [Gimesia algae]QDT88971.1 hypothetical protein Pan161_05900 [Gimesia algae]
MIDRERRNQLAALIRRYLEGKADASDFEKCEYENYKSDDPALYFVAEELPLQLENDANALTKQKWDYIQRLLLLLESNSTVLWKASPYRLWTQPVAEVLLVICLVIALLTGFTFHLFLYFIPIGLASILLAFLQSPSSEVRPFEEIVKPFHSIADLGIAYESTNFVKQRYPAPAKYRNHSSFLGFLGADVSLVLFFLFLICMPAFTLLLLCFPESNCDIKVQPA